MINREDIIWAAGLFEGEGCFYACGGREDRAPHAVMKMTDEDVVRHFRDVIGFGNITIVPPKPPRKRQWCWSVGSFEHFQATVAMLWPWLHSRRRAKAKSILKSYHELEPPSVKQTREKTIAIRASLEEISDIPLWGRRWKPGKTQRSIAREFGVSPGLVTLIKQKEGALRSSQT